MLLSEIPLKMTRNAIERIGLTENDLRCFETVEEVQRYIYLENRRRSNDKKKEGYTYMKTASYLIYKDNVSTLASLIDSIIDNGAETTPTWGTTV